MYRIDNFAGYISNTAVIRKLFLAIFWILGLLTGSFFAFKAPSAYTSLLRMITTERVSIIGLGLILFFPLIISAIVVHFSVPLLLLPLAFFKAFFFSFFSYGFVLAFGNAGWLVRWLFVFSDSCMIIPLLWLWFRNISGNRGTLKNDLVLCSVFAAFFGCIDYFTISPFTLMLFNH